MNLIGQHKTRPRSSRKETIKVVWTHGFHMAEIGLDYPMLDRPDFKK